MSYVLLATCRGAEDLGDRIERMLAAAGIEARSMPAPLPEPQEAVVIALALAPTASVEPAIAAFLAAVGDRQLPLVPVVEDLGTYDFQSIPYPDVAARNACGWRPDDGKAILHALRGHLGQEAFPNRKRIFLSYRREDGQAIADALYGYLSEQHYDVFLDTVQIEPGAVVQERIYQEIVDKDFILLIDTPQARHSDWVRAEIVEALNRRIPVRALAVGMTEPYPLLPDVERLTWDAGNSDMLPRVASFVSRAIGDVTAFDQRCRRLLETLAETKGLSVKELDRRRVRLRRGPQQVIFEHERALPSLERLHRLYRGYLASGRRPAFLICGDQPVPQTTRAAVAWARGRAPLNVLALLDVASTLDVLFP